MPAEARSTNSPPINCESESSDLFSQRTSASSSGSSLVLALWLNYDAWHARLRADRPVAATAASTRANGATSSSLERAASRRRLFRLHGSAGAPGSDGHGHGRVRLQAPGAAATSPDVAALGCRAPAGVVADAALPAAAAAVPASGAVTVRTDVLDVDIGLAGGELQPGRPDRLSAGEGRERSRYGCFNRDSNEAFYAAAERASPARRVATSAHPTHLANFSSRRLERYEAAPISADELRVPLKWSDPASGVTVTKTFVFRRGQYRDRSRVQAIENAGSVDAWLAAPYMQILRDDVVRSNARCSTSRPTRSRGPLTSTARSTRSWISRTPQDSEPAVARDPPVAGSPACSITSSTAVVPSPPMRRTSYTLKADGPPVPADHRGPDAAPWRPVHDRDAEGDAVLRPEAAGAAREDRPRSSIRVADYGKLTLLAKPLFWLLEQAHKLFGNWGWAIIADHRCC